jgi:formylglycine-generating enzyme required for sulfatase activity
MPARRWMLGSAPGGLVPENERWAHELAIPEFEIDALPVSWSRYVEFADDAGYDRRELWSDEGWAWLAASGRRAPRHVEQWCGAVVVQRRGRLERAAPAQPALHLTRHEAEAWCRWAGRRLPTEPEWELAACTAASRGFCWGEVHEWTAGSARPWPGHASVATGLDPVPPAVERSGFGVLRGASWMTRLRARHPKARRFVRPADDTAFCGFRSCALG